jgi:hypothetical protein
VAFVGPKNLKLSEQGGGHVPTFPIVFIARSLRFGAKRHETMDKLSDGANYFNDIVHLADF